ncbi:MAG: hypothetical protein DRP11_01530 [Candidatus Aenigmatarchaeota archaeon]|nr:MAG: hypothetical protein DRP11_01530 [Candidatus Aenigmarchaeota archaeon]
MKRWALITAISAILLSLPVWAELTKEDVLQIIRAELEPIKLQMAKLEGKVATKDDIHELYRWFIIAWITIILAIFAIPYLYGRADRERVKELEARLREEEKRIEEVIASVEALKAVLQREEKLREEAQKLAQEKPEFAEAFKRIGLL